MSKATQSLKDIFSRIQKTTQDAINTKQMKAIGNFAIDIIVSRTLLGYGVRQAFGAKKPLKKLSPKYIKFRSTYRGLSGNTRPSKSNLTLTGKMLESMRINKISIGNVTIGPTGDRLKIAGYQEDQGRTFNRLSQLEYNQVLRYYRKTFGDLLNKRKLLR